MAERAVRTGRPDLVPALPMLQPASAGGTCPVRTGPGFFAAIHPYLPMSYLVAVLTSLTARGREVVRMKDLHPELRL